MSDGNPIYDSTHDLVIGFKAGLFTPAQFVAARERILEGFKGVNPLGFDPLDVREQVGGTKEFEEAQETKEQEVIEQENA